MSLKSSLYTFIFLLSVNILNSQEYCGTTDLNESWISYYHSHKDQFSQDNGDFIYVPMLVHVLRTDDGEGQVPFMKLYRSLGKLNSDFEQVGVQFFLPKDFNIIDRTIWYDHAEFGDGQNMMRVNNVSNAINSYIVRNPAGNCGYYSPRNDGLALGTGCMGGSSSTWTHEMGHLLTLPHTFYGCESVAYTSKTNVEEFQNEIWGKLEKVDGSNCQSAGDRFCDTKPDYLSYRWTCDSDGKSRLLQTDLNGDTFHSNGKLFMSYSNDICTSIFSEEQIQAMRANLNGVRSRILKDTTPQTRDLGEVNIEMISPIANEIIDFQDIEINWKDVVGATHYYIEVSRRKSFSGNHTYRAIVQESEFYIDELIANQNYYIRILPYNHSAFNEIFAETIIFSTSDLTSTYNDNANEDIHVSSLIRKGESIGIRSTSSLESTLHEYVVLNVSGIQIKKGRIILNDKEAIILTNNMEKGIYFIQLVLDNNRIVTKKIIIQ